MPKFVTDTHSFRVVSSCMSYPCLWQILMVSGWYPVVCFTHVSHRYSWFEVGIQLYIVPMFVIDTYSLRLVSSSILYLCLWQILMVWGWYPVVCHTHICDRYSQFELGIQNYVIPMFVTDTYGLRLVSSCMSYPCLWQIFMVWGRYPVVCHTNVCDRYSWFEVGIQ